MSLTGLQDIISNFKSGKAADPALIEKAQAPDVEFSTLGEILYDQFGGDSFAISKAKRHLEIAGVFKDVVSTDTGPVRIVSLYPIIAQIYNEDIRFLNMLKVKPLFKCTDTQVRIVEETINGDQLSLFNEDGQLPPVQQAYLYERTQTMMTLGQQIQVSWKAEELAAQSPYRRNEMLDQLQKAALRMERTLNPLLLSGTEQTSESVPNIPRAGGFVTRSTLSPIAMNGSNFTDAFVSQGVDQMAATFGYNRLNDIVVLTNDVQLNSIRNLMNLRYPGNNAMTKLEYDSVLFRRLSSMGLTSESTMDGIQIYETADSGKIIPFIREPQLPAGTSIMFLASQPQLGAFYWGGQPGPNVVDRPITAMYDLKLLWMSRTIIDPLIASRVVYTGHP